MTRFVLLVLAMLLVGASADARAKVKKKAKTKRTTPAGKVLKKKRTSAPTKDATPEVTPTPSDAPLAAPEPTPAPAPAPALLSSPVGLGGEPLIKLAVYDLKASNVSEGAAQALNSVLADAIAKLGVFQVITPQAIASLLALERQKQLLGCAEEDSSCMTEIANALGISYIVGGSLTGLTTDRGSRLQAEITLLDVKRAARASSVVLDAANEAELMKQARASARRLVDPLIKTRVGQLTLTCSEKGALVLVDDQPVGTTPLSERLVLTAIPHTITVEKEGFVTWRKDITVVRDQIESLAVTLAPSADFAAAHHKKHSRLRAVAWTASAIAVASAGTLVYSRFRATTLFGHPDADVNRAMAVCTTFSCHKQRLLDRIPVENGVDHRNAAESLATQISSFQTISYVAMGVGAASAITAGVFWLISDNPDRYRDFTQTVAPVAFVPLDQGFAFATELRF